GRNSAPLGEDIYGRRPVFERTGGGSERNDGADIVAGPELDRKDDHDGWGTGGGGRSRPCPSHRPGKNRRVGNVSADAANGGLRDDATGGANGSSTERSGDRASKGFAAGRSESAGTRVSDLPGSGGPVAFLATISGVLTGGIRRVCAGAGF